MINETTYNITPTINTLFKKYLNHNNISYICTCLTYTKTGHLFKKHPNKEYNYCYVFYDDVTFTTEDIILYATEAKLIL